MSVLTTEQCCHNCNVGKHAIFGILSAEEEEMLNAEKIPEIYSRGDVVFEEGHYPKGLFCISQGKVKVTKIGDEGRDQIVRIDKRGEVLGYRSLFGKEPYSATATALEQSVICFIPSTVIFDFMRSNSDLAFRMMEIMAKDLKTAEERLTDFTQKPVKGRLAQTLLSLMETYGQTDQGYLDINFTRQEWANLMGTTTETAIRTLSDLNKEGMISLEGKKIRLLQPAELYNMAEL